MERRVKHSFKVEAAGDEQPGPVMNFKLVQVSQHQRFYRGRWESDPDITPATIYTSLPAEMSRDQLAELVTDGVDWLRYIETEGK